MGKVRQNLKVPARLKSETNALVTRKIKAIDRKQLYEVALRPMVFSYGGQPQIPTSNSSNACNPPLFYPSSVHFGV
jgi:hypothetical protein